MGNDFEHKIVFNTRYGVMNNGMKIYVDPNTETDEPVLLDYRGNSQPTDEKGIVSIYDPESGIDHVFFIQDELDGGFFYCPYVPLTT